MNRNKQINKQKLPQNQVSWRARNTWIFHHGWERRTRRVMLEKFIYKRGLWLQAKQVLDLARDGQKHSCGFTIRASNWTRPKCPSSVK